MLKLAGLENGTGGHFIEKIKDPFMTIHGNMQKSMTMVGEHNHCVRLLGEHIKEHNHGRREAICARKSQIP